MGSASNDCDIQGEGKPNCMEMDIIENNGNCIAQTTWHTWPNHNGDCDKGGCMGTMYRKGKSHIRAEFTGDGWMNVLIDGRKVNVNNPVPSSNAHRYVHDTMISKGAQIQSSQWVGWVPAGNCPGDGNLGASTFSVQNIKVSGTIVQGSAPPLCNGPTPSPSPGPTPSPSPGPTTAGQCCFGGCSGSCEGGYCGISQTNCEGNCKGMWCPTHPSTPSPTPTPPPMPTPSPSQGPATAGQCCFGGCGTSCQDGWCGSSQTNCEGNCKGMWCPGQAGTIDVVV